jgi:hypothetical protein
MVLRVVRALHTCHSLRFPDQPPENLITAGKPEREVQRASVVGHGDAAYLKDVASEVEWAGMYCERAVETKSLGSAFDMLIDVTIWIRKHRKRLVDDCLERLPPLNEFGVNLLWAEVGK